MKCPKCGFNSFDFLEKCKKCGSPTGVKAEIDAFYNPYELSKRYSVANTKESAEDELEELEEVVVIQSEEQETIEIVDEDLTLDDDLSWSNHALTAETDPASIEENETETTDRFKSDLAGVSTRSISFLIDMVVIFAITALGLSAGIYVADGNFIFEIDFPLSFIVAALFAFIIVGSGYFVFLEGYGGKTLGKMAMGLKVVGVDGGSIDIVRAFTRWAFSFFSALFFFIGFLWALFDARSQTWHDKIAGTLVVKE